MSLDHRPQVRGTLSVAMIGSEGLLKALTVTMNLTGVEAQQPQPPDKSQFAELSALLTNYFPVWVAIACMVAVLYPPSFLWFRKDYVTSGLALTMLAMGTTLSLEVGPYFNSAFTKATKGQKATVPHQHPKQVYSSLQSTLQHMLTS